VPSQQGSIVVKETSLKLEVCNVNALVFGCQIHLLYAKDCCGVNSTIIDIIPTLFQERLGGLVTCNVPYVDVSHILQRRHHTTWYMYLFYEFVVSRHHQIRQEPSNEGQDTAAPLFLSS
jgi:hypothetical protein